jgi:hypothetical protein
MDGQRERTSSGTARSSSRTTPLKPKSGLNGPPAHGHWDLNTGKRGEPRQRFDKNGKPITPEEAHGKCEASTPKTSDPKFIQKMSQITGLTGTALTIYIIFSEGSRIFPSRNLVPIP